MPRNLKKDMKKDLWEIILDIVEVKRDSNRPEVSFDSTFEEIIKKMGNLSQKEREDTILILIILSCFLEETAKYLNKIFTYGLCDWMKETESRLNQIN